MWFEYSEDAKFFKKLLCGKKDSLEGYKSFFDSRLPKLKRIEFNRIRNKVFDELVNRYGNECMLKLNGICDPKSGFVLDHLIPLSSNKLNKTLRKLKPTRGKKVLSQSFGSNHINNLVIACRKCNSNKKHRFMDKELFRYIIKLKITKNG